MKPATLIGIVLIIAGISALGYGTFSYKEDKTVFKLGDFEATTKEEKHLPLKPAGGLALAVGVVLVVVGSRK